MPAESTVRRTTAIGDLLVGGSPSFSFEFFPPRTEAGERALWSALRELEPLQPSFVSVTYGAGGSTRDTTVRLTGRIATETTMLPLGHLTAVNHSTSDLRRVAGQYADAGVRNMLALRGDPPGDPRGAWTPHPGGLTHAYELVGLLKGAGDFSVGVAAFPEKHPDAPDLATGTAHLLQKFRAGADYAITQFFFDWQDWSRLRDDLAAEGCEQPVVPGIMPVTNVSQIERMAQLSGAAFPADLAQRLHTVADDEQAVREVGVEFASALCERLLAEGAPGIHFITLNRSTATREVWQRLGLPAAR